MPIWALNPVTRFALVFALLAAADELAGQRRRPMAVRGRCRRSIPEHRPDHSHRAYSGCRDRSEEPEHLVRRVSVRRRVEDREPRHHVRADLTNGIGLVHDVLRRHRSEGLERRLARHGENASQRSAHFGDGVYKSTDAGKTWSRTSACETSEHIGSIVIDPRNSNVVWVAAQGPLCSRRRRARPLQDDRRRQTWNAV